MMIDTDGYTVALYIRLSVEDSKTKSMSIENQKHTLHDFVDKMEDMRESKVLEYIDNGYSGTNFERPAVQLLLDDVRTGKINCIAVKDFTRFGRSSIEVGYFIERVFPLYGIRFISINDGFDSNTLHGDTGGVNAALNYLAAEFYSRDLSIKAKSAKYVKFQCGKYQSRICPYGFQKGASGRLEPDEETAPVVRLIFELAGSGKKTREIAQELSNRKIPTPGEYKVAKGLRYYDISRCRGLWDSSMLLRILGDERYIGTYIMGKREVTKIGGHQQRIKDESKWFKIPDHHPALVSKELFAQVQAQRRRVSHITKNIPDYPLRGKVFCGCCGHALFRMASKSPTFFCKYTVLDNTAACHGMTIRETELEALIYNAITKQAQIILNLDNLSDVSRIDISSAEQSAYEQQIERCMERKRVLYEKLVTQEIVLNEYKAQKAEIDVDLDHWKERRSALAAQTEQIQIDKTARGIRLELAQEATSTNVLTTALVEKLIARVDVHPGRQIDISWKISDFCIK